MYYFKINILKQKRLNCIIALVNNDQERRSLMELIKDLENLVPEPFHIVDRYCNSSWFVPDEVWNTHNLMLVEGGNGIAIADGVRHELKAGVFLYHSPSQSFGYETSLTNPLHVYGINFHLAQLSIDSNSCHSSMLGCLPLENYCVLNNPDQFYRLFAELAAYWESSHQQNSLKCRSMLMNIIHELILYFQSNTRTSREQYIIDTVSVYIEKNYYKKITLESLATLTDLNPTYFGYVFKSCMNITPIEYLNQIRILAATKLLQEGSSISEAAFSTGFNDPFYFSKVFKKIKGISPREFKKVAYI